MALTRLEQVIDQAQRTDPSKGERTLACPVRVDSATTPATTSAPSARLTLRPDKLGAAELRARAGCGSFLAPTIGRLRRALRVSGLLLEALVAGSAAECSSASPVVPYAPLPPRVCSTREHMQLNEVRQITTYCWAARRAVLTLRWGGRPADVGSGSA